METCIVIQEGGKTWDKCLGKKDWNMNLPGGYTERKGLDKCIVNQALILTGKMGLAGAGLIYLESECEQREKKLCITANASHGNNRI